jgi:methanethiol oxidase
MLAKLNRSMRYAISGMAAAAMLAMSTGAPLAHETCQSPYMAKITGEEEYVYVTSSKCTWRDTWLKSE